MKFRVVQQNSYNSVKNVITTILEETNWRERKREREKEREKKREREREPQK